MSELSKDLFNFLSELGNPKNTKENPFFKSKYFPLPDLIDYIKPVAKKHNIAIIQPLEYVENDVIIKTVFLHSSGEKLEYGSLRVKAEKLTPQGLGSAITYGRRYALSSICGIASENDDDGNAAESNGKSERKEKQPDFDIDNAKKTLRAKYESVKALLPAAAHGYYEMLFSGKKPFNQKVFTDSMNKFDIVAKEYSKTLDVKVDNTLKNLSLAGIDTEPVDNNEDIPF